MHDWSHGGDERLEDLAFRYGGEEFCALLRKCDTWGGVAVYDRLREELARAPAELGGGASSARRAP